MREMEEEDRRERLTRRKQEFLTKSFFKQELDRMNTDKDKVPKAGEFSEGTEGGKEEEYAYYAFV